MIFLRQLEQKNIEIETSEINEKLKNEKVDVTLTNKT